MKINSRLVASVFIDTVNLFRLFVARLCVREDPSCWLISERGYEAKDNAYVLFKWLLTNHPELNVKYVIAADSSDLYKFKGLESHLVFRNTWKHYLYLWKARYLVSTHIVGFKPGIYYFYELDKKFNFFRDKIKVFLQHGIIHRFHSSLCKDNINVDLFICGAKLEYDFVLENFGFSTDTVKYTGLCRFDNLHNNKTKKQIVLMPTWRKYVDRSNFKKSDYYLQYSSLLTSSKLHAVLNAYGYELIFYPHWEIQGNLKDFLQLKLPSSIIVADISYDVQTLLIDSELLITDYSSVMFDMLYMRKPVICFQFDRKLYNECHYSPSVLNTLDYADVCDNVEDVIIALERVLKSKVQFEPNRLKLIQELFPLYDDANTKRVYDEIIKK